MLDGREHGGIIAPVGRHPSKARAVYTRVLTAANISRNISFIGEYCGGQSILGCAFGTRAVRAAEIKNESCLMSASVEGCLIIHATVDDRDNEFGSLRDEFQAIGWNAL